MTTDTPDISANQCNQWENKIPPTDLTDDHGYAEH